jgi:hypothetical protein
MRCRVNWHKWSRWMFGHGYLDSSFGEGAPSSMLVRKCQRCNKIQKEGKYGLDPVIAKCMLGTAKEV